jgi:hypothetical protein
LFADSVLATRINLSSLLLIFLNFPAILPYLSCLNLRALQPEFEESVCGSDPGRALLIFDPKKPSDT